MNEKEFRRKLVNLYGGTGSTINEREFWQSLLAAITGSTGASLRINNSHKTSAFTFVVPANYYIAQIFITNYTANAVTGGLKLGTTLNGADVISTLNVGANANTHTTDTTYLKRRFPKGSPTTIYVTANTAWNNADVDIDVVLVRYV